MNYSIAIDGPAGSGKSTIARNIAAKKGITYVDTGAMYRALALYFIRKGLDLENEQEVADSLAGVDVDLKFADQVQHILLNGEDVTDLLRSAAVTNAASVTSRYAPVREKLMQLQREMAHRYHVIMDGRDIGTVVLPDATLKVFLTASPKVRAKRRYLQLEQEGRLEGQSLDMIEQTIRERDERDSTRKNAPLKSADDAIVLDTSDMSIDDVESKIISLLEERIGNQTG